MGTIGVQIFETRLIFLTVLSSVVVTHHHFHSNYHNYDIYIITMVQIVWLCYVLYVHA